MLSAVVQFDGGGDREGIVGIKGIVVGIVGSGVVGNGGSVALGRGGIAGNVNAGGGDAGVSKRWRAAWLMSKLDRDNAIVRSGTNQCLGNDMVARIKTFEGLA